MTLSAGLPRRRRAGDPGLLTLRPSSAWLVPMCHSRQARPPANPRFRPADGKKVSVEDLPGQHPQRWPHIHQTMIDHARQGKVVVRLKAVTDHLWPRRGRGESLREAGIPYEIVPGITAAVAAAYAEIPLTHRACASAVALITGHENPTKPRAASTGRAGEFPGTLACTWGWLGWNSSFKCCWSTANRPTRRRDRANASTGMQITRTTVLSKLDQTMRDEG